MEDAKNLLTVMKLLDTLWDKLTSDLTEEQIAYLTGEINSFKSKVKSSTNSDEINDVAKDFYKIFSKIESMEELASVNIPEMRGASLPEPEEEIRIRLLNYCETMANRLNLLKDDKVK